MDVEYLEASWKIEKGMEFIVNVDFFGAISAFTSLLFLVAQLAARHAVFSRVHEYE
jgi:hypothetical protein